MKVFLDALVVQRWNVLNDKVHHEGVRKSKQRRFAMAFAQPMLTVVTTTAGDDEFHNGSEPDRYKREFLLPGLR
jgi:hypothetical protein